MKRRSRVSPGSGTARPSACGAAVRRRARFSPASASSRALFVMASNPVVSAPDASALRERLAGIEHLVVYDFFLSETARFAHVVLPTLQWAEESSTVTKLEGRVILRECVAAPPAVPALLPGDDAASAFEELRRAARGARADYSGITYARCEPVSGCIGPCRTRAIRERRPSLRSDFRRPTGAPDSSPSQPTPRPFTKVLKSARG
jgi:assimilatory nitrate reductase catalytic subunit